MSHSSGILVHQNLQLTKTYISILFSIKSEVAAPSKAPAPVTGDAPAKPAAQLVTPWDVQGEISADGKALEM